MIFIHMDGGIVQDVSTDIPGLKEHEVIVCDYDTEGATEEEIYQVPQSSDPNDTCEAVLRLHSIGHTDKNIIEYINKVKSAL